MPRSAASASAPLPIGAVADGRDLDVVRRQQLDDARAFEIVVLDDQQPLGVRHEVGLQLVERDLELAGGCRLDEVRERAVRQPVLALLLDRQHLHRDVAGLRVQLEVVEHRPTEHVGQKHVERDRGRREFAGE